MRAMFVAAFWTALAVGACGKQSEVSGPEDVVAHLSAGGQIRVDGRAVNLAGLSAYFNQRKRDHSVKSGDRARPSGPDVVLRVDPDAYWMHVQLLLTVCMEQKLYRTWFEGSSGRRVKVFQPHGAAIEWLPREAIRDASNALCVTIDIEHGSDGRVVFRCGDRTAHDADAVEEWVAGALERKWPDTLVSRISEIRVSGGMRFRHVFAVMEALADSAIERTLCYGIRIPTPAMRQDPVLPIPDADADESPVFGLGVRSVVYHPDLGRIWPD